MHTLIQSANGKLVIRESHGTQLTGWVELPRLPRQGIDYVHVKHAVPHGRTRVYQVTEIVSPTERRVRWIS